MRTKLISAVLVIALAGFGVWMFLRPPAAPVQTTFRGSWLDPNGLVLQVRNTSGKSLSCSMRARNNTMNENMVYRFSVGPWDTTEVGILESGWSWYSGETGYIEVEGCSSVSFTVP
jgi:hypothetical protein